MLAVTEIDDKKTTHMPPVSVMALGALALMTSYMSLMSFNSPDKTVFKSQFDMHGEQFNQIMFFVAFLSVAVFALKLMIGSDKKPTTAAQQKVDKAIYQAARKEVVPVENKYWKSITHEQKEQIDKKVGQTKKLLATQDESRNIILAAAHASLPENGGTLSTKAKEQLPMDATRAVEVAGQQEDVKGAVKDALWTVEATMAAGRRMQAISLGVAADPKDVALVDDVNRRAPLMIKEMNRLLLSDKTLSLAQAKATAVVNVPAGQGVEYSVNANKRLKIEGNDDSATIKQLISNHYWKGDTVTYAGNIAAYRSVGFEPLATDVEKTRYADINSRQVFLKTLELAKKNPSNVDMLTLNAMEAVHSDSSRSVDIVIHDKVSQYVWTSNPSLCYARERVELKKASSEDVTKVKKAEAFRESLFEKVSELLMPIAKERKSSVNTEANDFGLKGADVTDELIKKAAKLVHEELAESKKAAAHKPG